MSRWVLQLARVGPNLAWAQLGPEHKLTPIDYVPKLKGTWASRSCPTASHSHKVVPNEDTTSIAKKRGKYQRKVAFWGFWIGRLCPPMSTWAEVASKRAQAWNKLRHLGAKLGRSWGFAGGSRPYVGSKQCNSTILSRSAKCSDYHSGHFWRSIPANMGPPLCSWSGTSLTDLCTPHCWTTVTTTPLHLRRRRAWWDWMAGRSTEMYIEKNLSLPWIVRKQ